MNSIIFCQIYIPIVSLRWNKTSQYISQKDPIYSRQPQLLIGIVSLLSLLLLLFQYILCNFYPEFILAACGETNQVNTFFKWTQSTQDCLSFYDVEFILYSLLLFLFYCIMFNFYSNCILAVRQIKSIHSSNGPNLLKTSSAFKK